MNNEVGGGTKTSRSGVAVDGGGEDHEFFAVVLLAGGNDAETVAGFYAPAVGGAIWIGEGGIEEAGELGRGDLRVFGIWAEGGEAGGEAAAFVSGIVGDLGGDDGAKAADGAGLVGGDFRAQEIGNGDGGGDQNYAGGESGASALCAD